MNLKLASFAIFLAFPMPCFAGKQASVDLLKATSYESIVSTNDQTPRFTFHAPKGLNASHYLGGLVGVFMHAKAAERGSMVISEYKLNDPAIDIAEDLAGLLGERMNLTPDFVGSGLSSSVSATHFTLRSAKDLSEEYGPRKLVVNVGTLMWTMQGVGDSGFRIMYSAKAHLVDTSERAVLASAECTFPLKRKNSARQAATMFNNGAESLKAELKEIVDYCANKLKTEMFAP